MTPEPKIVLLLPLSNEALLPAFVEKWIPDKVSLIAIVGEGCARIEDEIEGLIVGDGTDDTRFITTSSHPDESLEEVVNFATTWWINADGPTSFNSERLQRVECSPGLPR